MQGALLGADSLLRKLNAIPARALTAMDGVLADSAQAIESGAKDRAPTDTTELKDGIEASVVARTEDFVAHQVESEADHTIHVEFGTSDQHAQPMLRPAFDENAHRAVSRTKTAVKAVLR